MRGFILRALPAFLAALAAGCFTINNFGAGDPPGAPRSETHAYWQQVNAILSRKPAGGEMKQLVQLVREQTASLQELSPEGVDPELAKAVEDLIAREEEVIRRAEIAGEDPEILKRSQAMAVAFADANRQATESKKRLKALRKALNERHGGGFAAPTGW